MSPLFIKRAILAVFVVIIVFFGAKYSSYLSLESFQNYRSQLQLFTQENYFQSILLFFSLYVVSTAVSLPGATVLTLVGGALFGIYAGLIVVSFASTVGATISFLLSRFLFRDWIRNKFQSVFQKIDDGFNRQGNSYLFSMRLLPIFPFFAVNALMGLTRISTFHFFVVSQIGMLPGTILYVWAGTELGQVTTVSGLISPQIFLAFAVLALFPYLVKSLMSKYEQRKNYSKFKKPSAFDYNLVVIGAGAAGLVSTAIARAVKAKVAIIENHKMGGDCLNYGCVPSKALIHASHKFNRFSEKSGPLTRSEFEVVKAHIQGSIKAIEPHDSIDRFKNLGADVYQGTAKIISPWEVRVDGVVLRTKSIIIASGAAPFVPKIPGLELVRALTSETIWDLEQLPKKLIVIGGGPIGCEISQSLNKLGVDVLLIEKSNRLLSTESALASETILRQFKNDGIKVSFNTELQSFVTSNICRLRNSDQTIVDETFDAVFFAIGRKPRVENLGLEELGISTAKNGTVEHNEFLQTNFKNIYVCGDVAGPIQLTHVAGHQAWYAAVNSLFSMFKTFKQDLRVIPRCTFTYPEVASVGLSEAELQATKQDFEITHYPFTTFDRAVCDQATNGFVRLLTAKKSDQILGVTIVAPRAGEMISEFTLAMRWKLGLKKILATVHAYPTWSDANKLAALAWQKKHVPTQLLALSEKFHEWKRT